MEVDVFTNTYNKHAKKAWKKTKCKRQVRKIGKTMEKDFSKEPAAYTMFGSREERDEEGEREQLKQQQEERVKRNQEWRARKHQEQTGGTAQKIINVVDKKKRNERIQELLICTQSRKPLRAGDEIWTNPSGDPVRGDFVDLALVKMTDIPGEEAGRRGSGPESGIEEDLGTVSGRTNTRSLSHTFSQLEVGSYVRPALDNIDFFANTLDIRKDAIRPYENYNPQEEEEVMSHLGGSNEDETIEETEFYNKYLHECCPPPIQSSAAPDSSLRPVTLDLAQEGETDTGEQKSWRQQFEMNKREVDFFSNTLNIRKDAIAHYQDYKKEAFSKGSITDEEESDDSDSEEEDVANDEHRMVSASQQLTRNLHVERIVKLFNEMMVYRNIIEDG